MGAIDSQSNSQNFNMRGVLDKAASVCLKSRLPTRHLYKLRSGGLPSDASKRTRAGAQAPPQSSLHKTSSRLNQAEEAPTQLAPVATEVGIEIETVGTGELRDDMVLEISGANDSKRGPNAYTQEQPRIFAITHQSKYCVAGCQGAHHIICCCSNVDHKARAHCPEGS